MRRELRVGPVDSLRRLKQAAEQRFHRPVTSAVAHHDRVDIQRIFDERR
jgi:hypothetical protein